jgi:hypothetical protein
MDFDFDAVGDRAVNGDEQAQLYWMGLGRLMSTTEHGAQTPQEIHEELLNLKQDVFAKRASQLAAAWLSTED